jgi:hypothetical protein
LISSVTLMNTLWQVVVFIGCAVLCGLIKITVSFLYPLKHSGYLLYYHL